MRCEIENDNILVARGKRTRTTHQLEHLEFSLLYFDYYDFHKIFPIFCSLTWFYFFKQSVIHEIRLYTSI